MREAGTGGVGISSQASYLTGVLETASEVWRLAAPVQVARDVRGALKKLGMVKKSGTRSRRVLDAEVARVVAQLGRKITATPLGGDGVLGYTTRLAT